MGKYYVNGYVTPEGINSSADVKRIQAALGVKQEGVWGVQTQAAWRAQGQGSIPAPKPAPATEPTIPRSDYAVSGFTPPEGVTDRQKVQTIQANLGVKQDGVWGVQTQAAWEKQYGSLWQEPSPAARPPVTAPKEYAPPKGIDSVDEIRQVQQRLKVAADGIWGKQTQEAWDKMRSPQAQSRPMPAPSHPAPSRIPLLPTGPYRTPVVAERTSDAILARQISNSQLGKTDQGFATAFAHSLTGQQKEKLINWMKEQGAENTVSVKRLPNTMQRLVKETVTVPTEIKMSKELERSAPFRPHMENIKDAVPGITFSNYYYKEGNYYVRVYNNGEWASTLELGPQLPVDSIIRTRKMGLGDLLWDVGKFGLSFYTQPSTWASFGLQNKYGDDMPMMLPPVENVMEAVDHAEPEYNYYPGRIVVGIYTPPPTSTGNRQKEMGEYRLRDTAYIDKK